MGLINGFAARRICRIFTIAASAVQVVGDTLKAVLNLPKNCKSGDNISIQINKQLRLWWAHSRIRPYIGWEDGIAVALILLGALGHFDMNIRSELIGIGITVLIIDNVNEMYRRQAEKDRLILQMGI